MAQIFSPRAHVHSKLIIIGVIVLICGAGWATSAIFWSPYSTYVNVPLEQPVPFSHKHHVGDDGIDCRYCHASVETSAFAEIPSTQICMSCHSQPLDRSAVAPAGAAEPNDEPATQMDARQRPAGLHLFQPQHSSGQRGWLLDLPRRNRPHGVDLADRDALHEMVPRLSPRAAEFR